MSIGALIDYYYTLPVYCHVILCLQVLLETFQWLVPGHNRVLKLDLKCSGSLVFYCKCSHFTGLWREREGELYYQPCCLAPCPVQRQGTWLSRVKTVLQLM